MPASSPGQAGVGTLAPMTTTYATYQSIAANLPKALARAAAEPAAARETAYFKAHISDIKSVDDFVKDTRIYTYVLKAFGLQDISYAKALIRKVLDGGVDSASSLANKLADPRYKELATAFNFARYGEFTTGFAAATSGAVDKHAAQTLEAQAGAQNPAVQLALYFQRKAPGITSAYSILADAALLKVAQTALGLDPSNSRLDIDRQAKDIEAKLNIKDLQDPAKLQKFLASYTAKSDAASFDPATAPSVVLAGGSSQNGLSADLLISLQSIRRG